MIGIIFFEYTVMVQKALGVLREVSVTISNCVQVYNKGLMYSSEVHCSWNAVDDLQEARD